MFVLDGRAIIDIRTENSPLAFDRDYSINPSIAFPEIFGARGWMP
jgi:hypothetical protein